MSRGKLPEGVGKKIVEALKKQAELDLKPELQQENQLNIENQENIDINDQQINQIEETSINNDNESLFPAQKENIDETINQNYPPPEPLDDSINKNSFNIDFSKQSKAFSSFEKKQADKTFYNKPLSQQFNSKPMFSLKDEPKISMDKSLETRWNFNSSFDSSKDTLNSFADPLNMSIPESKDFDVPTNVAVLRNLIKQLPSGVAKQTGAQIIRQTLEALGISMSSVLNEAQGVQDSLNDSIRECMSTIQEYKNQMMVLEKQAQDYQRQVSQLNDLISLFIMTDKK